MLSARSGPEYSSEAERQPPGAIDVLEPTPVARTRSVILGELGLFGESHVQVRRRDAARSKGIRIFIGG